jgi:hypothetical protein
MPKSRIMRSHAFLCNKKSNSLILLQFHKKKGVALENDSIYISRRHMYGIRKGFQNTQHWSHEEDIEGLLQERLIHMLSPIGGNTYCIRKGGSRSCHLQEETRGML